MIARRAAGSVAAALARALLSSAYAAGLVAEVADASERRWASATFEGTRHRIVLRIAGDGAAAWAATLAEAGWRLPGHLVADLSVDACEAREDGTRIVLSVLTLVVD